MKLIDLTGKKFKKLTVMWPCGRMGKSNTVIYWMCACDCGKMIHSSSQHLMRGRTISCGCVKLSDFIKRITIHGKSDSIEWLMAKWAKQRAKKRGTPFSISYKDIVIPDKCPFLGIPLHRNKLKENRDSSPSLDCIESSKGYVQGNIRVISHKANTMKSNSTLEEFEMMAKNWRELNG